MSKPLVSVVVPAYNEEKYLEHCLEALNAQNLAREKIEIIVVDNNSTDKTATIAQASGAIVVKEEKQGYVHSLKKGMSQAKGEIIAVTDADSRPNFDWLEKIYKALNSGSEIALTGSMEISSSSGFFKKLIGFLYTSFLRLNFLLNKPHLTGFNFAVKKWAYNEVGGLDQRFGMSPDVDLGLRLKVLGKVSFHKEVVVQTSARRWQGNIFGTFFDYAKSYFYTVWLRKPPSLVQEAIR